MGWSPALFCSSLWDESVLSVQQRSLLQKAAAMLRKGCHATHEQLVVRPALHARKKKEESFQFDQPTYGLSDTWFFWKGQLLCVTEHAPMAQGTQQ
jgi:hypothetical protein